MGNTFSEIRLGNESRAPNRQLFGSSSGRFLARGVNNQTIYSVRRSSSLNPPRRFTSTSRQTLWPLSQAEAIFLPEFPVSIDKKHQSLVVGQPVAKGAYGQVYRASEEGKDYALKVLSKARVVSEKAVSQVKEEAKIQQLCGHHKFIVNSVSRWQTKKNLYILSEYIGGGELFALLQRCRILPELLVKIYVAELGIALDFLHNAGVIYRDLKPENVLLDSDYHLQLVDFGLSKWLSRGSATFTVCGTANYMAPEILSGQGYSHAVDWWSLGVVMYRMLTHEYPAPEGSGVGALPHEGPLSEGAHKLLTRLLEADPRRRLRSVRELRQTAFYMQYNFDDVQHKKMSPKSIVEKHFPELNSLPESQYSSGLHSSDILFKHFDSNLMSL